MNDIFFSDQNWDLQGEGDFDGKFHLFKGGHDVSGRFKSEVLGWNDYRFPDLAGALQWTPTALDVRDAGAKFFGGDAQFDYSIKPLGQKNVRSTSRFEAQLRKRRPRGVHATSRSGAVSGWPVRCPDTTCSNGRPAGSSSAATKGR